MDRIQIDSRFAPAKNSRTFQRILRTYQLDTQSVFDIGCGFGEHLIQFGEGSVGITTTREEVEYGKEKKINIQEGNIEQIEELHLGRTFERIWANNLFEHLLSPHRFLVELKTLSHGETLLILGVPVIPRIVSLLRLRKFRGALAMAHINFFTRESLRLTVERAGWKIETIRPFFFGWKSLDILGSFFAPHLYVVAKNDPKFRYHEKKVNEWKNNPEYRDLLNITKSLEGK